MFIYRADRTPSVTLDSFRLGCSGLNQLFPGFATVLGPGGPFQRRIRMKNDSYVVFSEGFYEPVQWSSL